MEQSELRALVKWHKDYVEAWDARPEEYLEAGVVQWGRSRRLGLFSIDAVKAYIGVQHVDPSRQGWAVVDEPSARFFLSLFLAGRCVTLRTFPTMVATLEALDSFQGAARR